jgi:ubiquinone/menaquinone biosynthesis C-methylase UbiE
VLEVACSSGHHSEIIAKAFLRPGARLASCDFSQNFVEQAVERYKISEFTKIPGNSVHVDMRDFVSDSKLMAELRKPEGTERIVHVNMADNMRLPYEDASFDCYVSNLSLMIVPDYRLQIREAYRVLQPGSWACFSVWGRPERTIQFNLVNRAMEQLGREITPEFKSNFDIQKNQEEVKNYFRETGFSNLRAWYQPANWFYRDGQDFV